MPFVFASDEGYGYVTSGFVSRIRSRRPAILTTKQLAGILL
jgi:hypothetical protein